MCLIAFAIRAHSDYPLVVAANRDEYWHRPTLPLQAWALPSGKTVYAGRDEQAGGTWIGFSTDGRVAMLTNVRSHPLETGARSRGELVTQWLDSQQPWREWIAARDPLQYGGFNLILGDVRHGDWVWLTNRKPTAPVVTQHSGDWYGHALADGIYGVSNAGLDTPWPKTVRLKQALNHHLQPQGLTEADLLAHLWDITPAEDADLPQTGVPLEWERGLSSIFVHMPDRIYGTRSSLLARWHRSGLLDLQEWTHPPALAPSSVAPFVPQHHIQIPSWGLGAVS